MHASPVISLTGLAGRPTEAPSRQSTLWLSLHCTQLHQYYTLTITTATITTATTTTKPSTTITTATTTAAATTTKPSTTATTATIKMATTQTINIQENTFSKNYATGERNTALTKSNN